MGFFTEFVRHPHQVGALAASTAPVVRRVSEGLDLSNARCVVELGAGTGAVTAGLRQHLAPTANLLAIEVNPRFASELRRRFATADVEVVEGSAVDVAGHVRARGIKKVDAVISALPWSLMSAQDEAAVLDGIGDVLTTDGQFVTLLALSRALLRTGRSFRDTLVERFSEVRRMPVAWASVPPMFAYHCTGPIVRRGAGELTASDPAREAA